MPGALFRYFLLLESKVSLSLSLSLIHTHTPHTHKLTHTLPSPTTQSQRFIILMNMGVGWRDLWGGVSLDLTIVNVVNFSSLSLKALLGRYT
jgi:hypothetical protein